MKLAIIGSRNCPPVDIEAYLKYIPDTIVSGGAKGADTYAREFAKKKGLKLIEYFPNYDKYGKGAPLERNKLIVDECDCVLALWDGTSRGTKFTLDYAKEKGKPVKIIHILLMVVETMTYKEIWSEIKKDYDGIIKHKIVDAEKTFRRKALAAPSTLDIIRLKPIHFKSRTTNLNHCIILYSLGKNDYKKNGMLFVLYSYIYREYGIYAFMLSGNKFDTLAVYTPHFFSRYRERYIEDTSLKMDEVLEDFFVHNDVCQIKDVNNINYPNSIFASTKDGVLLGTKHPDNILEFKTFLSSELLKEQQIDLHNSQNEITKNYLEEIYGTSAILQEQKPFKIIPISKEIARL